MSTTNIANYAFGYTDQLYFVNGVMVTTRSHRSGVIDHNYVDHYATIAIVPGGKQAVIESLKDGHFITGNPVTIDGVTGHDDYLNIYELTVTDKGVFITYIDGNVTRVVHAALVDESEVPA